jgi:hypothetical protein
MPTPDFDRMRRGKRFVAVGMRFRGGHIFSDGDVIRLEAEPDNEYDANAIKVMANGKHVAYVARDHTQFLKPEDYSSDIVLIESADNSVVLELRD